MSTITKQELHIYRGTYKECMAQPTEDMEIYLAWDTQEMFIGNKKGAKVKYGGTRDLTSELDRYFVSFRNELYANVDAYAQKAASDKVDVRLSDFDSRYQALLAQISNDINGLRSADNNISSRVSSAESSIASQNGRLDNLSAADAFIRNEIRVNSERIASLENKPAGDELPDYDENDSGKVLGVNSEGKLVWVIASTGPISKTAYSSTLLLRMQGNQEEVGIGAITKSISYGVKNGNNGGAVNGSIKLNRNGVTIDSFEPDNSKMEEQTKTIDVNIDKSEIGTTTFSVTATPFQDTSSREYRVSGATMGFRIYKPAIIKVGDNEIERANSFSSKEYEIPVRIGDTVRFYSPVRFSNMIMGGFPANYSSSSERIDVNGVSVDYDVYSISIDYLAPGSSSVRIQPVL